MECKEYKGYQIKRFHDGLFDIEQDGELIDGDFESEEECAAYIDSLLNT